MKIYKHEPVKVVRVNIVSKGQETESFTLTDCTQDEVIEVFKEILGAQRLQPFGNKTSINIREQLGGHNSRVGKSKTLSLNGIIPSEVLQLFKNYLNK